MAVPIIQLSDVALRYAMERDLDGFGSILKMAPQVKPGGWRPELLCASLGWASGLDFVAQMGLGAGVDEAGMDPAMHALCAPEPMDMECLWALKRLGWIDPKASDADGWGLCSWAAQEGKLVALEFLASMGADVDLPSMDGATPLMLAARAKRPRAMAALSALGADFGARDSKGRTAMHYAAQGGCQECVGQCLRFGLSASDSGGDAAPLILALMAPSADAFQSLIDAGADASAALSDLEASPWLDSGRFAQLAGRLWSLAEKGELSFCRTPSELVGAPSRL